MTPRTAGEHERGTNAPDFSRTPDATAANEPARGAAFARVPDAPRSDDPAAIARLREALIHADFTASGVNEHLGEAAVQALSRDQAAPALRVLAAHRAAGTESPLNTLIPLFILARPVPEAELVGALTGVDVGDLECLGLIERLPGARIGSRVDLDLHSADNGLELWVTADLTAFQRPGALRHDYVLGIGGASLTLAQITERRQVSRALDIGTGCGVQIFHLLGHADHVVATDLSRRALAFARFNLVLNAPALGLDPEDVEQRVELREGSLLDPVAGERFELVVTNPPFVITPRTPTESEQDRYTYRDGGRPGDSLVAELIGSLDTVMAPGATAHLLANWEIAEHRSDPREGQVSPDVTGMPDAPMTSEAHQAPDTDGQATTATPPIRSTTPTPTDPPTTAWAERIRSWIPSDLDAWVIQRETATPEQYAETWLRDASEHVDCGSYERSYTEYLDDFAARGVQAVGFGYVRLQRPVTGGERRRRFESITHPLQQPIAAATAATTERQDVLEVLGDRWRELHLVAAEDVTEERHQRPGAEDPSVILLRQGSGLQRSNVLTSAAAGLVGACDGELSVEQIVTGLGALLGWAEPAVESPEGRALLEQTHHLLVDGFLVPDN